MRTRHKRLSDYGVPAGEAAKLYDLCRGLDDRGRDLFHAVTMDSCPPGIAEYIFKSLSDGSSYDAMSKSEWIPIGRDDFYGYRRKALAALYWARKGINTNETKKVIQIMDEARMNQEDICLRTGLSAKSFEWILENGYASIDAVERIADVLKVEANQIITDNCGENENVLEFLKDNDRATVTFCQGRFITRVRKLAGERPDECQIVAENKNSIVAHIPVS